MGKETQRRKKGHGLSPGIKEPPPPKKKEQEASQDQGVGSPFCLDTAAPFPPPGRECK